MKFKHILGIFIVLSFVLISPIYAQDNNIVTEATQQLQGLAGELFQRIELASQTSVMQLAMIVGGTILIFIGWRIYNFVIIIAGALSGALLAVALLNSSNTLLTIIAMLIGGTIGGFLAIYLYYIAVFVIGAYMGVLLTLQILAALNLNISASIALIVGGIIGGLVMLGLSFELLVIISSIVGGQMLSLGLGLDSWWTIGFIIFGIIWQITFAKVTGYKIRRRPTRRMLFREV